MKQQLLLGSLIIRKGQLIVPLEGLSFARQSWRVRWGTKWRLSPAFGDKCSVTVTGRRRLVGREEPRELRAGHRRACLGAALRARRPAAPRLLPVPELSAHPDTHGAHGTAPCVGTERGSPAGASGGQGCAIPLQTRPRRGSPCRAAQRACAPHPALTKDGCPRLPHTWGTGESRFRPPPVTWRAALTDTRWGHASRVWRLTRGARCGAAVPDALPAGPGWAGSAPRPPSAARVSTDRQGPAAAAPVPLGGLGLLAGPQPALRRARSRSPFTPCVPRSLRPRVRSAPAPSGPVPPASTGPGLPALPPARPGPLGYVPRPGPVPGSLPGRWERSIAG